MKIVEKKIENINFITLCNENGLNIVLCSFGASIYQLETINHYGVMESVILTPSNLNDFYYSDGYFGKSIGRFSGRIDEGKCYINDKLYILDKNWNNINSLHGGNDSISFKNFDYTINESNEYVDVSFTYFEKENKLPGDVNYNITYRIFKDKMEFSILFNAISNKETLINLTNHTYFNLSGNIRNTIINHKLKLNCDSYCKSNNNLIPVEILKVDKVMDFRRFKKISKHINDSLLLNHTSNGYDHCFIKNESKDNVVAILKDKKSKRKLTITTSYPAIVCYTCNYPAKCNFNAENIKINKYHGICFECQYVVNGINMENVDKAIFKENEQYSHYINYHFDN